MDRQFLYPCPKWDSQTDFGRELAAEVRTREYQILGASCIDEYRTARAVDSMQRSGDFTRFPRTHDIWVGINRLRQILPRFTFRIPACERGLEALCNYHTVRTTSTGLAADEPMHDWASHAASALKVIAEAEMAGMLSSAGSTANIQRQPVTVKTGFRGNDFYVSILDRFFGKSRPNVRVIR